MGGKIEQLRVWGGPFRCGSERHPHRAILATKTKAEAIKTLGVTEYFFRSWWSETGNEKEVSIATKMPKTIFISKDRYPRKYEIYKREGGAD